MNIEQSEKLKYERIWKGRSYRSRSAVPFAYWLMEVMHIQGPALEIGCGDGATMEILKNHGIDVHGCDITLAGYKGSGYVMECPAWDLLYGDKEFNCTFSTDTLEHIPPEKVLATVNEIIRVTRKVTIHQVATFEMGNEHLTVKKCSWWENLFESKGIEVIILERKK